MIGTECEYSVPPHKLNRSLRLYQPRHEKLSTIFAKKNHLYCSEKLAESEHLRNTFSNIISAFRTSILSHMTFFNVTPKTNNMRRQNFISIKSSRDSQTQGVRAVGPIAEPREKSPKTISFKTAVLIRT